MGLNPVQNNASTRRSLAAERRVVTILFSDVKGSTAMAEHLDPEDWAEIMNEAFDYLTSPIIRYGGTVARLMGDSILAFFGAPTAHEDDPLRAVLAGLDIVSGIQQFRKQIVEEFNLDFNVRVGINTGVVVVGEMGTALAGEYTAMGDAVNLAARMEQTASSGTVQITGETYRLVAPWVSVESLGGIEVKGKSEPIQAYCVLERKTHPDKARGLDGLASPLVGRNQEYTQLDTALADLIERRGRIVTLVGEAGLGKSRLIEETRANFEQINTDQMQWIESRGISYETASPYSLFGPALRQACQIEEGDPPDIVRDKIAKRFQDVDSENQPGLIRTVELVLSVHQTNNSSEYLLEGEALKLEIFENMINIWSDVASRIPLILVFDDLHWADATSVDLLIHLFQLTDQVPILFICAFRPYRTSPAWQLKDAAEKDHSHRYSEIVLSPLNKVDSGILMDNILEIADLPEKMKESILRKSEGNPFFLEEVVRTLIDNGQLQRGDNGLQWQATSNFDDIDIPDNLQALLLARIDRLKKDARLTLQLASVIGRFFLYSVLQAIGDKIDDLDEELVTLQRMDLIREEPRLPELEYVFRHELTRDAAYQSILRRQRRRYHREVGNAIEELFPDRKEEYAHRLAYHFNAARDYSRALKYYKIAGDQSLLLFANQEANEYFQQAIDIALKLNIPSVQLAGLYISKGKALELLNYYDQALDNYEELEQIGRTRYDRSLELAALVPQTTIYSTPTDRYNPQLGAELSRKALNLALDLRDYESEAKLMWSLMLIETFSIGDLEKALLYGEQGLRIARDKNLQEAEAYLLHDIARPYMRTGRISEAWNAYESSNAIWNKVNNLPMLADNLASMAELSYVTGEFDRSLAYATEGLTLSKQIGNTWGQAYNTFPLGAVYLERGDIDDCLTSFADTLELSQKAKFVAGEIGTLMLQTWIYVMFGDLKSAEQIKELIKRFVKKYESFTPLYEMSQALYELTFGEHQEAQKIFQRVGSGYHAESEVAFNPYIYSLHVEIYLANEDFQNAMEVASQYITSFENKKIKLLVPDLLNQKARALIGLGLEKDAYPILLSARSLAAAQNSRRILWAILLDLAELEEDRSAAENYRQEAKQIIAYISDHMSDPNLRESFLGLPRVQKVI
jgi:predicted ATPase/class 3 adenylate cyclase